MKTPLQITFRSMVHSDSLSTHIRQRVEQLEALCDEIISCHVTIELSGHHHSNGDSFRVCINVGLSGAELIVNHDPTLDDHRVDNDAYAATDQAFDAIDRKLQEWANRHRADVHQSSHGS